MPNSISRKFPDDKTILDIKHRLMSNYNILAYEKKIESIIKDNKHNESYIPYDLSRHTFKKEFIYTLFVMLNIDLQQIRNELNLSTRKDNRMGFSILYDMININIDNQPSKSSHSNADIKIISCHVMKKMNLHRWYLGQGSNGLRSLVSAIADILCGEVIDKKWHPFEKLTIE